MWTRIPLGQWLSMSPAERGAFTKAHPDYYVDLDDLTGAPGLPADADYGRLPSDASDDATADRAEFLDEMGMTERDARDWTGK